MSRALLKKSALENYTNLRSQVRAVISAGKRRAQDAVEREKVRTCWNVGKLINEHVLLNRKRANYGAQVVKRLSADLSVSDTELHYMMEFARTSPIFRTSGKLSWGHIQSLLRINDAEEREAFTQRLKKGNWSVDRTRREIRRLKIPTSVTFLTELLIPIKGTLDTYRIVNETKGKLEKMKNGIKTNLRIDLGFSNYLELPEKYRNQFKEGDIVTAQTSKGRKGLNLLGSLRLSRLTIQDLFTYRVKILDATDADTIWLLVELGFGISTKQHVRLRGIDAPEITTRAGQAAKHFIERELKKASSITITSTKSDKYDRYLADVFYVKKGKEFFLNNELLKRGFATRVA